jgi:hypothetical protein
MTNDALKKISALAMIVLLATARAGYGLSVPVQKNEVSSQVATRVEHQKEGRSILLGERQATLSELFGLGSISTVFDVGSGNGLWLRHVRNEAWLARNAIVIGSELENPIDYYDGPGTIKYLRSIGKAPRPEFYSRDWSTLEIVSNPDDYPSPGSMDLVHIGFMHGDYHEPLERDMSKNEGEEVFYERLATYDALLKNKGWLLIAHYLEYPEFAKRILKWLNNHGYEFIVYSSDNVPEDYPTTAWWDHYREYMAGEKIPYLIVAQKHNGQIMEVPMQKWGVTLKKAIAYLEQTPAKMPAIKRAPMVFTRDNINVYTEEAQLRSA